MRRAFAVSLLLVGSVAFAASGAAVSYDATKHSVSFTVISTDCGLDMQLEFLFTGPGSDREYESMFATEASVQEIADAFDKAGIPRGVSLNPNACRFWPVGNALEMEPAFTNLVREMRGETLPAVIYTGGLRETDGTPQAHTNMPCAVFALYNLGQSLLTLNDTLDQSVTYGRFQPAVKIPKGEKRTVTFTWKGNVDTEPYIARLSQGNLTEVVQDIRAHSQNKELDVLTDFSPELTVKEANLFAQAFAMLDSARIKINGFTDGQLFFRAFLPREQWRDRKERLAQPPEVHFKPDGGVCIYEILEDWSGDEDVLEPKLTEKTHVFSSLAEAAVCAGRLGARTQTILLFAAPDTKLARIYEFKKGMGNTLLNWYVFTE